jgi:hypothetical protein
MILLQIRVNRGRKGKMIGMSRSILALFLLLPLALGATACSDDNASESPTSPTAPQAVTDPPITGTLSKNGATTYVFIANTGTITATLTTVTPDTAVVGLALGEWNATTELCQLRLANDNATQGKLLIGSAQLSQQYCVRIADVTGALTAPVSYEISITHF